MTNWQIEGYIFVQQPLLAIYGFNNIGCIENMIQYEAVESGYLCSLFIALRCLHLGILITAIFIRCFPKLSKSRKQARKLQATLVRNYDLLAYLLTGVKCRATSVAKNPKISDVRKMLMSNCISVWPPTSPHKERYCQDRDRGVIFQKMGKHVAGTISLM